VGSKGGEGGIGEEDPLNFVRYNEANERKERSGKPEEKNAKQWA